MPCPGPTPDTTSAAPPTCLASVALERNRWGSREPSIRVSGWLGRVLADGFAGVELWEHHFLRADADERARLAERAAAVAVFNTYAGFGDGDDPRQQRDDAAEAIARLEPEAVKYNLGGEAAGLDAERERLIAWADRLPTGCRLLCECHPGTAVEEVDAAAAFHRGLDAERFGIIAHVSGDDAAVDRWAAAFGLRLGHLHLQLRTPEADPTASPGRERLAACVALLKRHGYAGTATVEFTRGMGRDEQVEALYRNAVADRAAFERAWQTA